MSAVSWAVVVVTLSLVLVVVIATRAWASSVALEPMPRRAPLALPAGPTSSVGPESTWLPVGPPSVPVMGLPGVTVPAEALPSLQALGELGDLSDLAGVLAPSDAAFLAVLSLVLDEGGRR